MSDDQNLHHQLTRIAEALERLAVTSPPDADLLAHAAYRWTGAHIDAVTEFSALPPSLITGVDRQKHALAEVLCRHADGFPAHDVLLWGARGTGKSVLVKALTADLQRGGKPIALVECGPSVIATLPHLFARLARAGRRFIVFIDDIAFDGAGEEARAIRSMLDGGVEARPDNVRLCVTSNRRNIIARPLSEQIDSFNPRDGEEDALALADRFGLKLGFQRASQDDFLAMVSGYAAHFGLTFETSDALQFAHQRGGQSGRTAWHYVVELAGRQGKSLTY